MAACRLLTRHSSDRVRIDVRTEHTRNNRDEILAQCRHGWPAHREISAEHTLYIDCVESASWNKHIIGSVYSIQLRYTIRCEIFHSFTHKSSNKQIFNLFHPSSHPKLAYSAGGGGKIVRGWGLNPQGKSIVGGQRQNFFSLAIATAIIWPPGTFPEFLPGVIYFRTTGASLTLSTFTCTHEIQDSGE